MVDPTQFVRFNCEGQSATIARYYTASISAPTSGWQYRVNGGSWQQVSSSAPTQSTLVSRSVPAFTIDMRPTTAVTPGTNGAVSVSMFYVVCVIFCGDPISDYSATLQATRLVATPTAADLQLSCTPATMSRPVNEPQTISCTFSARQSLGVRQVSLAEITVPMPAGWSISSETGTVTGSTLTLRPNTTISYDANNPQSHAFSFVVTPSCTSATTTQPVPISTRFSFGATTGIAGPAWATHATRTAPSPLALSVRENSLAWSQEFSLTTTTVSGSLRYRVATTSCTGWNVQISASPFSYSGPNNGQAIPVTNFQLTASGVPSVINGSGTGVTSTGATGTLASPKTVVSAPAGVGIGTFEQELGFQLTIPGRALAGTYTSTITITSTAAP